MQNSFGTESRANKLLKMHTSSWLPTEILWKCKETSQKDIFASIQYFGAYGKRILDPSFFEQVFHDWAMETVPYFAGPTVI